MSIPEKNGMKPLSRIGWFCLGLAVLLEGVAFAHYNGLVNPGGALLHLLAAALWGGVVLAGLFVSIMALLFLSA